MLPVSPLTEMRRSVALAVVMGAVVIGLAVPVAIPVPSVAPDSPDHSETTAQRSPGEGVATKVIVSVADGLLPTMLYTITVFSLACDQI